MPSPGRRLRLAPAAALVLGIPALAALVLGVTGGLPLAWRAPGPILLPWRLLAGVALGEVVLLRRVRRLPRRRVLVTGAVLLAAGVATFALRQALVPAAFFHQNGQGPLWAAYALCGGPSPYGPGYAELLAWLPTLPGAGPEGALFAYQALAAAPALVRAGQSESYYTPWAALLFAAAAVLALGASGRRRLDLWLGIAAAGLLVAQAARVHPVGWLAAAVLPAVLAVGRGRARRCLWRTVVAALGIGAVVAITTGPALLALIQGPLGHQWLGRVPHDPAFSRFWWKRIWLGIRWALPLAGALLLTGRGTEGLRRALVLLTVPALMLATELLGPVLPAVRAADLVLWLPVPLAAVAVGLSGLPGRGPGRRATAALVGTLAAAILVADLRAGPAMLRLPTDVLEARVVAAWRRTLPPAATVVWLGTAGERVAHLPVYPCGPGPHPLEVRDDDPGRAARAAWAPDVYYVRDSLCATPEGAPACARLEATLRGAGARLVPVARARVPARPSMAGLGYPRGPVTLELLHRVPAPAPRP